MQVEKKTIEKEVVTTVSEDVYIIELNYEEACALHASLGAWSGHVYENNLRATTDKIWSGLQKAGISWMHPDVSKYSEQITRRPKVGTD